MTHKTSLSELKEKIIEIFKNSGAMTTKDLFKKLNLNKVYFEGHMFLDAVQQLTYQGKMVPGTLILDSTNGETQVVLWTIPEC